MEDPTMNKFYGHDLEGSQNQPNLKSISDEQARIYSKIEERLRNLKTILFDRKAGNSHLFQLILLSRVGNGHDRLRSKSRTKFQKQLTNRGLHYEWWKEYDH